MMTASVPSSCQCISRRPKTDFCSVFLPAAGQFNGNNVMNGGNNGYYWSSSPNADNANNAQYLNFNSSNANVNNDNRNYVYSVRAVLAEHLPRAYMQALPENVLSFTLG